MGLENNSQKTNTNKQDSITNVNFSDYAAKAYFANRRVVMGVRVDEGIAKRFKLLAKQCYGSVCRAIEVYMVNFIEATERGVNFCYTSKPINIDKIVIERNLRSRRKLEFEEEVSEFDGVYGFVVGDGHLTWGDRCAQFDCERRPEYLCFLVKELAGYWSGLEKPHQRVVFLCREHFVKRRNRGELAGWRKLENG